jgi:uncharacterized membrane protein
MTHISKSIHIKVDQNEAIEYISDVRNHPAFISTLKSVSEVDGDEQELGRKWKWVFTMAGVEFLGGSQTTRYEAGKVFAYKTDGDVSAEFTYSVEPEDEGVRLNFDVEYEMPDNALAAVADKSVVEHLNEGVATGAVESLKAILEG